MAVPAGTNLAAGPSVPDLPPFMGLWPHSLCLAARAWPHPLPCPASRTACLGTVSCDAISSQKPLRRHFPLCPRSFASPHSRPHPRVVSTSSKGSLKMESHVQTETLRNLTPGRGEHLLREGGRCLSHLSGYQTARPQAPSMLDIAGTLDKA